MPSISVIMPVYNVGKYLRACIDSILAQTFTDYELILVNDGSTDESGKICDEYAASYDRITVIHKTNEGAGPTRNAGIAVAKGEYLAFPDADDYVSPEMLDDAYRLAKEHDADFVMWGAEVLVTDGEAIVGRQIVKFADSFYATKEECREHFMDLFVYVRLLFDTPWAKLYKRAIIYEKNLSFPPIKRGQDAVFNLDFFNHVSKIVITSAVYYYYRDNDQDKSWMKFPRDYIDIVLYYDQRLEELAKSWGIYGDREKLFFDRGFTAGITGAISQCLNPNWKLGFAQKYQFINNILRKPYIVERIKDVVVETTEMQRNKTLIQRKAALLLLLDVYIAHWGKVFRKNVLSHIPIIYAIFRYANKLLHGTGARG